MKKTLPLVWNVYNYGFGDHNLRVFNVFDHRAFMLDVEKILKADLSKEEFAENLRREVQYYYWSKCEWECVITDTHPHIEQRELDRILDDCYRKRTKDSQHCRCTHVNLSDADKIDVYDQLRLNWDEFVEYVWEFRKPRKSRVKKMPNVIDENAAERSDHEG